MYNNIHHADLATGTPRYNDQNLGTNECKLLSTLLAITTPYYQDQVFGDRCSHYT